MSHVELKTWSCPLLRGETHVTMKLITIGTIDIISVNISKIFMSHVDSKNSKTMSPCRLHWFKPMF